MQAHERSWKYSTTEVTNSVNLRIVRKFVIPTTYFLSMRYGMVAALHRTLGTDRGLRERLTRMLKILRSTTNGFVTFALIGRIEGESLAELKRVISEETPDHNLVLDLKDVTLVDQAAIRFLARCEAESIVLEYCPAYVRDWIAAERRRSRRRK
jgi:hypothetical protein